MPKILGLIPARSGSKGIPGKNLKLLNGKPLLAYTAEAAQKSGILDRIVLSTDSEEIAKAGRSLGIEVPFMRPKLYAQDDTPMMLVVRHALDSIKDWFPDTIVLLQPTSPLRTKEHICTSVEMLDRYTADSVVSVVPVPPCLSPDYVLRLSNKGLLKPFLDRSIVSRRQDARQAWSRDGTIYTFSWATPLVYEDLYGEVCVPMFMDPTKSLSIDTAEDWKQAEQIVRGVH